MRCVEKNKALAVIPWNVSEPETEPELFCFTRFATQWALFFNQMSKREEFFFIMTTKIPHVEL